MNFAKTLSRNELKNVMAGMKAGGGGCYLYCCNNEGTCSKHGVSYESDATSNGGCQQDAVNGGVTCAGDYYVAALYK